MMGYERDVNPKLKRLVTQALKANDANRIMTLVAAGMLHPDATLAGIPLLTRAHFGGADGIVHTLTSAGAERFQGLGDLGGSHEFTQAAPHVRAVAGNDRSSYALMQNGDLWGWRTLRATWVRTNRNRWFRDEDWVPPKRMLSGIASVLTGKEFSLALREDGTVFSWGRNADNQLGDGSFMSRNEPQAVLGGVRVLVAGDRHVLAVTREDELLSWGYGRDGQLGVPSDGRTLEPTVVLSNVRSVAAGANHSLAIQHDGTLVAWGANWAGQVGNGTNRSQHTPKVILRDASEVTAGTAFSIATLVDGKVLAWGGNWSGQLGTGTTQERHEPTPALVEVPNIKSIHANSQGETVFAITTDDVLWQWGVMPFEHDRIHTNTKPKRLLRGVTNVMRHWSNVMIVDQEGQLWPLN